MNPLDAHVPALSGLVDAGSQCYVGSVTLYHYHLSGLELRQFDVHESDE